MTRGKFNTLTFWQQVQLLGIEGTYLAQRDDGGLRIELWHLPGGGFVDAYYSQVARRLVALRSLSSLWALEPFLAGIELPPL